jgi:uncharacterized protein YjbJ (UPF0337 family)
LHNASAPTSFGRIASEFLRLDVDQLEKRTIDRAALPVPAEGDSCTGATSQEIDMGSGTGDKAKGRVKEAAGVLSGDRKLKNEGKLDQAAGSVKNAVDKVSDKAKKALKKA